MDPITIIAHTLGINAGAFAAYLVFLVMICNLIGRVIPDSATGYLGIVRKVAKIVGLYVANRITPGVNTNTTSNALLGLAGPADIINAASEVKSAAARGAQIGLDVNSFIQSVLHPSLKPGLPASTPGAPAPGSIVPNEYRTDPGKK